MTQSTHPVLTPGQPKENVLFMHLRDAALTAVLTALHRSPFHRHRDFVEVAGVESLQPLLFENRPQLLVMNMFAEIDQLNELIRECREKFNPQLVVVLTTIRVVGNIHLFDRVIHKDHVLWGKELVDTMQDFLSGKMRRQVVPHLQELIAI